MEFNDTSVGHSKKRNLSRIARLVVALGIICIVAAQPTFAAHGPAVPYATGDVFAGIGNGKINHFSETGVLKHTLDTTSASNEDTGMCFDSADNLYSTNFTAGNMTKFDNGGNVLVHPWATGFTLRPESCVVDASDNIYVGSVDPGDLRQYNAAGALIDTDNPLTGPRGVDWIDLAADQCTIYYTSEGPDVRRFDACTDTQLLPFAVGAGPRCFALRIRANGEVLVACQSQVTRLSPTGTIMQVYPAAGLVPAASFLFALNLAPDGNSFWTADLSSGQIYRVDIATGSVITTFDGGNETSLAGLAVFGEPTQGGGDQCPPGEDDDGDDNGDDLTGRGLDTNSLTGLNATADDDDDDDDDDDGDDDECPDDDDDDEEDDDEDDD